MFINKLNYIIIIHQQVMVTPVMIMVSYNQNTISIQIIIQMCDKTDVKLDLSVHPYCHKISNYIIVKIQ
jgi:hypothetical protein